MSNAVSERDIKVLVNSLRILHLNAVGDATCKFTVKSHI